MFIRVELGGNQPGRSGESPPRVKVDGWVSGPQLAVVTALIRSLVQYPRYYSSFTPSFAPTHDSSSATNGFGYYQTWEAGMGKAAVHSWLTSGWNGAYGSEFVPEDETAQIEEFRPRATKDDIEDLLKSLADETEMEIDPALVDAVDEAQGKMRDLQRKLDQNAVWMRQLQQFQEIRLRRGQREPLEEEERIGEFYDGVKVPC